MRRRPVGRGKPKKITKEEISAAGIVPMHGQSDPAAEFAQWLKLVSRKDRDRLADMLENAQTHTYNGLLDLSVQILRETLRGTITPIVAYEARSWVGMMIQAIAAKSNRLLPGEAPGMVSAMLQVHHQMHQVVVASSTPSPAPDPPQAQEPAALLRVVNETPDWAPDVIDAAE